MKATQPNTTPRLEAAAHPDERYDILARVARRHTGASTALITLFDGTSHTLHSSSGPTFEQSPHKLAQFADIVHDGITLIVPDTFADERFRDHPLVVRYPFIRFFTASALLDVNGTRLGTLCLLDNQPRHLDSEDVAALENIRRLASLLADQEQASPRQSENEQRMALAIDGSGTGIWDRDVRTNEIHYSAGWKAILGYKDSEIGNLITDSYKRVHPDDLAYVQATIQAHFDARTSSYEVEHRLRCKDGSYKWVSSRGKVISRDSDGKPLRMIGTTTDITALRSMSETLQQTVNLITNLTNEVPGLVFQYRRLPNGSSFFSYASAGIKDIYEIDAAQVATSAAALDQIIHRDDLVAYHSSLEESAARLEPWQFEYRVVLPKQGLRWRQGSAHPQRLVDGSTMWHGFITDVTDRKRAESELQMFASTDFLTQLPNRRHFMSELTAELARIRRYKGRPAAILMYDLDHFKSINDSWGHAVGDLALRHFAGLLRAELRRTDVAGRVGGEEFAVMLRYTDPEEAMDFARRVRQRLAGAPLIDAGRQIAMTVSTGISIMSAHDSDADASLSRSDTALYRAKTTGRNRIEYY